MSALRGPFAGRFRLVGLVWAAFIALIAVLWPDGRRPRRQAGP